MSEPSSVPSRGFGYWLTIFANLAVVGGIIFLGVEIRQNSQLMKAQTRHELSMAIVEQLSGIAENAQLASVIRRGNIGEELTPDEGYQYLFRSQALVRYWENVHYQYRQGLYDEVEFAGQKATWQGLLARSSALVDFWCTTATRMEYSPEFREEIDGLLSTYKC